MKKYTLHKKWLSAQLIGLLFWALAAVPVRAQPVDDRDAPRIRTLAILISCQADALYGAGRPAVARDVKAIVAALQRCHVEVYGKPHDKLAGTTPPPLKDVEVVVDVLGSEIWGKARWPEVMQSCITRAGE